MLASLQEQEESEDKWKKECIRIMRELERLSDNPVLFVDELMLRVHPAIFDGRRRARVRAGCVRGSLLGDAAQPRLPGALHRLGGQGH